MLQWNDNINYDSSLSTNCSHIDDMLHYYYYIYTGTFLWASMGHPSLLYYQKDVLRLFWQPVLALNLLNVNIDQILPFINVVLDHLQVRQTYIYISRGTKTILGPAGLLLRTCRKNSFGQSSLYCSVFS